MSINHLPPKVLCSSVSNTTTPAIGYGSAAELQQQVVALIAGVERLNSCLRYEQHRAERVGTCGPGCEIWGPAHYECAVREIEKLQHSLADRDEALEKNLAMIVHLSGRLAACREREARMREALDKIAWGRAPGPMNNKLAQQYEQIAVAALAGGVQG